MTPFSSMARNCYAGGRLQGRPLNHLEHHGERAQSRGPDGVLVLRRADLAVPGLHLIELARFERPYLPRQRVRR